MEKKLIAIIGGGESGVGAAILAKDKGFDVFLSDSGSLSTKYRDILLKENIPFEEGKHSREIILKAHEVVKSPGVPPTCDIMKEIFDKEIPVISEIEFASRYTDSKMVCITGSNGKTTTTMLTHHIFVRAGIDASLAGNIGKSLAYQVARDPHEVYVIELSSFQLENMYRFKANVAVILNITPDHLDRYDYKFQNYIDAKFRIINNMSAEDAFIYWEDDPVILQQLDRFEIEARQLPFSRYHKDKETAAWLDDDNLVFNPTAGQWTMPRADLALNGLHNVYNSMAAGLSASFMDIKKDTIREALADFKSVEHRLEFVDNINGVDYINDSKATNVNSCWYALESMPKSGKSVVLILGGKDKGNDYSEIQQLVEEKVKAIVAMGKDNSKIISFFRNVPVFDTHSMEEAVNKCHEISSYHDTVLLSPCCASFDLFNSYEHRGKLFKEEVLKLKK